jgi:sugar lactone lactonase YvrE
MTNFIRLWTRPPLSGRWLLSLAFAVPLWAQSDYSTPYVFTTLAGTSSIGSVDGTGSEARFYRPQGVAVGSTGIIYVADSDNNTIRKISPTGVVTTLAGSAGQSGAKDGVGSAARFDFPSSLVVDAAGNVYVADANNHAIRRITPAGEVTTYAGSLGTSGSNDGNGAEARFHRPEGIAIDPAGNLYIADAGNQIIRKIAPDRTVSTLAGQAGSKGVANGIGSAARFATPFRIAIAPDGTIYVVDLGSVSIRKITPSGVVSMPYAFYQNAWGAGANQGDAAPAAVAVDASGRVFFTDSMHDTVSELLADGTVSTVAGARDAAGSSDGNRAAARFRYPVGLAADLNGNLFVADRDNNAIRQITSTGSVTTIAGLGLESSQGYVNKYAGDTWSARFNVPYGLGLDSSGNCFVADTDNNAIRMITPDGLVQTVPRTSSSFRLNHPTGLALDHSGNVYIADAGNYIIRKMTPDHVVTTLAGTLGVAGHADGPGGSATFSQLYGLAVDASGNVYVRDSRLLRKITPDGTVSTLTANLESMTPYGLAVDGTGQLYVSGDHAVMKVDPVSGATTTLAGFPTEFVHGAEGWTRSIPGSSDGVGASARFRSPEGLAVDADGNVFVCDTDNQTIRKIAPDGTVTTIAGLVGAVGSSDGAGDVARFASPSGIALDASGNLYVASGNTIRRGQPTKFLPRITAQPQSQSVTAGGSVVFSVTASSPTTLSYRWNLNGTAIAGATGSSLTVSNVQTASTGDYTVIVSNADGSVTSNKATLTVTAAPSPTPTPTPSGGGGGAIDVWFVLALLAAGVARYRAAGRPNR